MTSSEPTKPDSSPALPSNRKFGLLFGAVFVLIGLCPLAFGSAAPIVWALAVAAASFTFVVVAPDLLEPLNKILMQAAKVAQDLIGPSGSDGKKSSMKQDAQDPMFKSKDRDKNELD